MMSGKILSRLNRRSILLVAVLTILLIGLVFYLMPQKPIAERIGGYTWCLLPWSPFLKWTFNEDGSFERQITYIDGSGAGTRINKEGAWSVYGEAGRAWIQVVYKDTQEEESFPIKTAVGSYYLRLEGNFQPLNYKTVNLYRCARQ